MRTPSEETTMREKKLFKVFALAMLIGFTGLMVSGCQNWCCPSRPVCNPCDTCPEPVCGPGPEPCPACPSATSYVSTELYVLEKSGPCEMSLGDTAEYTLRLTPKVGLVDVTLTDLIPDGFEILSVMPQPSVNESNFLRWHYDSIRANSTELVTIQVKALRNGSFDNCAVVSGLPVVCLRTDVHEPSVAIEKCGPARMRLGECCPFRITVTNTGNCMAKGLAIRDVIPDGLAHSSGNNEVTINVGYLALGESKTYDILLTAVKSGRFCNEAYLMMNGNEYQKAEACVMVVEPALNVMKEGPTMATVCTPAEYTITVSNNGNVALNNISVIDEFDGNLTLVNCTPEGQVSGNRIMWTIPTLRAGQSKTFTVTLCSQTPGNYADTVTVCEECEQLMDTASVTTCWSCPPTQAEYNVPIENMAY